MRSFTRFFILSALLAGLTAAVQPTLFGNENAPNTETSAPYADSQETIFLEFVWMHEKYIREALLMVPPQKVPMLLVRVLDENEKMTGLAAARCEFLAAEENQNDLTLECAEPKTLYGSPRSEMEIPSLILLQGHQGAVDLNGKLAPCLIAPVLPDNIENILEKYCVPEEGVSQ